MRLSSVYGHTMWFDCERKSELIKANTRVKKAPPMNPSQVFFGDNFIKGVLPKKNPTR